MTARPQPSRGATMPPARDPEIVRHESDEAQS
jgi:hypothetical protein